MLPHLFQVQTIFFFFTHFLPRKHTSSIMQKFRVHGNLRGTNFRNLTALKAKELNVTGYTYHHLNDTVVLTQGNNHCIHQLAKYCEKGTGLNVERIKFINNQYGTEYKYNYSNFEIRPNVDEGCPHDFYDMSVDSLSSDSYDTLSGFIRKVNVTFERMKEERRKAKLLKQQKEQAREVRKAKKKKIKIRMKLKKEKKKLRKHSKNSTV